MLAYPQRLVVNFIRPLRRVMDKILISQERLNLQYYLVRAAGPPSPPETLQPSTNIIDTNLVNIISTAPRALPHASF